MAKSVEQFIKDHPDYAGIVRALEHKDYVWRTLDGLKKDTGAKLETIEAAFAALMRSNLLVTATSTKLGKLLFTTRRHYEEKESGWNKFLSSVSGSIRA